MKKRVVSLLLCLIMALSLIPTVAFATEVGTGGTPTTDANKTTNGKYVNNVWTEDANNGYTEYNNGKLRLYKTAEATNTDNEYTITLKVETSQTTTTTTTTANAATVLVIDTSGSMAWCTKNHRHTDDCYNPETMCTSTTNPDHWVLGFHKVDTSCRLMYGNGGIGWYLAKCGTSQHTHDYATGGEWCQNKDLKSATDSRIANAKTAAKAFLDSYKDATAARWVAIVSFADNATSSQWYNVSTPENLIAAKTYIDTLSANGGTNLDAGLSAANTLMANNTISAVTKANKNVIALTDGAPTKSQTSGNGKYGSKNINTETENTATALKGDITGLYTICFAASNEVCYQGGPSVGAFLKDSIASTGKDSTVDEGADLPTKFKTISNTITSGLTGEGGWTVTDPMADNISVVDTSLPTTGFVESNTAGTYTWTLGEPTTTTKDNTTTYTYEISYNVKINPNGKEADGTTPLSENKFYPTNGVTTLHYKDASSTEQHANFPVPGVKVKLSAPTEPETGTLTITKKIVGLPFANVPAKSFEYFANPAASNYANGTKLFTLTVTDTTNGITARSFAQLPVGKYSLTESPNASQEVTGYTLVTTISVDGSTPVKFNEGGYDDIEIKVGNTSNVVITDTYTPNTPGATTAKITINKKVDVTGNTQPTATTMPTFQFVAKVGNTEVGKLSLTPTKGTDGKWTASGVMDITIPAKLFGANSYVEVKVSEVKGTLTTWTYDTHPEMFYINKDGQRITLITAAATAAEVVPATDSIATFTFTNKYSYTYTPTPKPNPRPTPKPVPSAKTGDMGIALYALTSLLSLSGTALVIKKRKDEE